MLKLICILVVCLCVVCSPSASATSAGKARMAAPSPQGMIWTGQSGGFVFQWSAGDISARPLESLTGVMFSVKSLAQRDFEAFREASKDPESGKTEHCLYDRTFTLLSVVGPIISLRDNNSTTCDQAAHPGGETRYTAIDLSKAGNVGYKELEMEVDLSNPGKIVKLTDIFGEAEILSALLADPLVREALSRSGSRPQTLSKLIEEFAGGANVTDKHCYSVSEDMLTRFAFHHIENGKVAVRLGLSGAGPCREFLTEIGILLPIPPSLRTALAQAEAGKEGFLMKDLKKISRNRTTTFSFETTKKARR